ncbi:hypothetical protein LCGC14_0951980 [marine sediment metagenome]|uniref:Uncharacterized protein n=1 Tax=marine sediment metagenome TaxID=412755 RepID=A0A0F9NLR5_9ZZZZ
MKKILRDLIEDDIDKVLDNNEIKKKNFFFLLIHYLLGNDVLNLREINKIATELNNEYEAFLKDFDIELTQSNGEIINVLKSALPNFNNRIRPILERIEKIKQK